MVSYPILSGKNPDHIYSFRFSGGGEGMDAGAPPTEAVNARDIGTVSGSDPRACHGQAKEKVSTKDCKIGLGKAFIQTLRHFWPDFSPLAG